ncbi:hypothetical protein [Plantactinospora sp. GCM10030261]|uniref:hypothetical protein n=1 Tax=Plantactinospora sp. GCM10030261 TaxID=3273420 RepID=UPI00360F13C4
MHPWPPNGNPRLSLWLRVRRFAVPPSMIATATARRIAGDGAGACAAARVDVDLDLGRVARDHGHRLAAQIRDDVRHLAPDLLRWHLPRTAPDGLLRAGLTVSLARYHRPGGGTLHLVARTPPAWADGGQRFSLALWDGPRSGQRTHPHPRPDRRFRLDLHRHLWDVRRTGDLRTRSAVDPPPGGDQGDPDVVALRGHGYAVDRWVAEARILLRADSRGHGPVAVRLGSRRHLLLDVAADDPAAPLIPPYAIGRGSPPPTLPVLPDAATWVQPDLDLLRTGLIEADQLHPLVASALAPDHRPADAQRATDVVPSSWTIACQGAQHRIAPVDGVLVPLDHDPAEIRREELLAAFTGTPLPCLQAIDEAHRHPECLDDVRARLDHGDVDGALAIVESLLGANASLRDGPLREELATAALRQVTYGLFRAGLVDRLCGPPARPDRRPRHHRTRPRHTIAR